MKLINLILVIISTSLLVVNQIALKFWLRNKNIVVLPLNIHFFKSLFSFEILISFLTIGISGFIWVYLLKKVEFSILYPMISISYIFGMLAAILIFKESVTLIRWIGVLVIMLGVFLVTRN